MKKYRIQTTKSSIKNENIISKFENKKINFKSLPQVLQIKTDIMNPQIKEL